MFRMSALFVLLMFFATLMFYRELGVTLDGASSGERPNGIVSVAQALEEYGSGAYERALHGISGDFSGFWILFWQQFIALPLYIRGYVDSGGHRPAAFGRAHHSDRTADCGELL